MKLTKFRKAALEITARDQSDYAFALKRAQAVVNRLNIAYKHEIARIVVTPAEDLTITIAAQPYIEAADLKAAYDWHRVRK